MSYSTRYCQCGNRAIDGRPTCGISICMVNDAYERAIKPKPAPQPQAKENKK